MPCSFHPALRLALATLLLLVALSSTLAVACGGSAGPAGLAIAKAEAPHFRPQPVLLLNAGRVRQGGAFTVTVQGEGLREGVVLFGTHTLRLGERDGGLWAAVAADVEEEPGTKAVFTDFTDDLGTRYRLAAVIDVVPYDFPVDYVQLQPGVASLLDPELVAQEERLLQATLRGFSPAIFREPGFRRPADGPVTTAFGELRVYNGRRGSPHRGMDIGVDESHPVLASAGGTVVIAQALPIRGNYVMIDHGLGLFTGYGHLSELRVAKGETVAAGTTVGLVGSTGLSTGPHLHWDAVAQGVFFDPQELINGALGLY